MLAVAEQPALQVLWGLRDRLQEDILFREEPVGRELMELTVAEVVVAEEAEAASNPVLMIEAEAEEAEAEAVQAASVEQEE